MPTSEERREVAHKLRELADENEVTGTPELFADLFGILGDEPPKSSGYPTLDDIEARDSALMHRLADLIDPQERTCRMERVGSDAIAAGWYACSECGLVYPPCNDEIAKWALRFCPHCGAKVVTDLR